jgi:NADH:ubiquinone oxidoreductase subunit 6 (subunit J)
MSLVPFLLICLVVLGASLAAFTRRNLVHASVLLVLAWAGVAAFYLWAGAEFLAFVQMLVYVGAVSMVVLFAVVLTRPATDTTAVPDAAGSFRAAAGVVVASAVAGLLVFAIVQTPLHAPAQAQAPVLSVADLGKSLMASHAAALLIVGVLLTVALIGAIVIASPDRKEDGP